MSVFIWHLNAHLNGRIELGPVILLYVFVQMFMFNAYIYIYI